MLIFFNIYLSKLFLEKRKRQIFWDVGSTRRVQYLWNLLKELCHCTAHVVYRQCTYVAAMQFPCTRCDLWNSESITLVTTTCDCESHWDEVRSAVNESITVRSEERAIYTLSRNLTVQIYVGSFDADLGTSDINRKHCSQRVRSPRMQVGVGTPGKRRDFRRAQLIK